jgi:dimethylaniline monooxygenase (N-oxide forming)
VFSDGTRAEVDAIIYATGYTVSLPFLPPGLVEISGNRPLLYKHVFPPGQVGLALVGYFQAHGSIPPLAEMQARWVARVFAGRLALPPEAEQRAEMARQLEKFRASGAPLQRLQWLAYMDEIASLLGTRPRLWGSPRRLVSMLVGPPLPGQYR